MIRKPKKKTRVEVLEEVRQAVIDYVPNNEEMIETLDKVIHFLAYRKNLEKIRKRNRKSENNNSDEGRAAILNFLSEDNPLTLKEITNAMAKDGAMADYDLTEASIRGHLSTLEKDKLVRKQRVVYGPSNSVTIYSLPKKEEEKK